MIARMRHALDLFSWDGRVSRRAYLLAGLLLFAFKYPIDLGVSMAFHREWNPLMYLSPRVSPLLQPGSAPEYWVALCGVALPFIYMGLSLTVRRLRDIGVNPFWAGLFFLPFLHFAFFLALAVAPSPSRDQPQKSATPDGGPFREGAPLATVPPSRLLTRAIPRQKRLAYLMGLLGSLLMGLASYVISVQLSKTLGTMLFVGLPFGMGFFPAYTTSYGRPTLRSRSAIGYGCSTILVAALVLLAVAWEGVACLVMALPILLPMAGLGGWVGWLCADRRFDALVAPLLLLLIPGLVGMDVLHPHAPESMSVVSTVTIAAPASVVWNNVVSFPPIDAPPAPIFAIVAMPLEARIDGHDPGATRRCVFTNGVFIEPIKVWDEPRELTFGVQEQPGNIGEYIDVNRGQFLLQDNGDGTTTLRGTTWYELKVFPVAYWRAWTERFLHAIHLRVLNHVKKISEHPADGAAHAAADMPSWMAASNATCACTRHKQTSAH